MKCSSFLADTPPTSTTWWSSENACPSSHLLSFLQLSSLWVGLKLDPWWHRLSGSLLSSPLLTTLSFKNVMQSSRPLSRSLLVNVWRPRHVECIFQVQRDHQYVSVPLLYLFKILFMPLNASTELALAWEPKKFTELLANNKNTLSNSCWDTGPLKHLWGVNNTSHQITRSAEVQKM